MAVKRRRWSTQVDWQQPGIYPFPSGRSLVYVDRISVAMPHHLIRSPIISVSREGLLVNKLMGLRLSVCHVRVNRLSLVC